MKIMLDPGAYMPEYAHETERGNGGFGSTGR